MKSITLLTVLFSLSVMTKTIAQTVAYAQVKGEEIELSKDTSATLLSFSGKYNSGKVYLYWTVKNQKQDGIYIIYRSSDSVNYEAIGTKTGVGVLISKEIAYYFTDEAPFFSEHSYYRIIHIGKNQTFLLSKKIVIGNDKHGIAEKTF